MKCAVLTCLYNNLNVKQIPDDISFHRFPQTLHLRKKWLENIGRSDWLPTGNDCVCSLHFKKFDFSLETNRRKLLPGSLPLLQILEVNEAVPWDGDISMPISDPNPVIKVATAIKTSDKTSNVPMHWDEELDIPIYPIPTVNSIISVSDGSNESSTPIASKKPTSSSVTTKASNGLFTVNTPTLKTGSYVQPTIQFSVQPITIQPITTIPPISSISPISSVSPIPTIKIEDDDDSLSAMKTAIQQHIKENVELVDVNEIILDKQNKVIGYRKVTQTKVTPGSTTPIKRTQLSSQPHRTPSSQSNVNKNNLKVNKPAPPPSEITTSIKRTQLSSQPHIAASYQTNVEKNNLKITKPQPPPPPLARPPKQLSLKQALDDTTDDLACFKCEKLRTQVVKQKKTIRTMNQQLRRKSKQILRLKMMLILMKERIQKGNNGIELELNNLEED